MTRLAEIREGILSFKPGKYQFQVDGFTINTSCSGSTNILYLRGEKGSRISLLLTGIEGEGEICCKISVFGQYDDPETVMLILDSLTTLFVIKPQNFIRIDLHEDARYMNCIEDWRERWGIEEKNLQLTFSKRMPKMNDLSRYLLDMSTFYL